ncbi:MAG TPA: hypothetical protein VFL55_26335, partial [Acetobacteraceae bacterium]|nr:hypothetical protein [Acetobacteraceae bacterium]
MSASAEVLVLSGSRPPPRKAFRLSLARVLDVVVIACVMAGVATLIVRANTGLGYHWNWSVIPTYLVRIDPATGVWAPNLLLVGFFTTIKLAVWSLATGCIVGTVAAVMRVSGRPALRWL